MEFQLYSSKNIKQCTQAITERLKVPGTKARPAFIGNVDKEGKFTLAVTTPVFRTVQRTTRLRGTLEKQGNLTVIRGYVPHGVPRDRIPLIMGAASMVSLLIMANGQIIVGLLTLLVGAGLYIPLVGDSQNSATLIKDLKRTLEAKDNPPN
jgi:hypothetical protein